jgi:hypothetical protein
MRESSGTGMANPTAGSEAARDKALPATQPYLRIAPSRLQTNDIPESIQHKQLGLISRKANLVDRVIHQLHSRIQHRVDAFEVQQVAALHADDIMGVSCWATDVLRRHGLVVFQVRGSHGRWLGWSPVGVYCLFLLLFVLLCCLRCAQEVIR